MRGRSYFLFLSLALIAASARTRAQTVDTAIQGTVTDISGVSIPGATVSG